MERISSAADPVEVNAQTKVKPIGNAVDMMVVNRAALNALGERLNCACASLSENLQAYCTQKNAKKIDSTQLYQFHPKIIIKINIRLIAQPTLTYKESLQLRCYTVWCRCIGVNWQVFKIFQTRIEASLFFQSADIIWTVMLSLNYKISYLYVSLSQVLDF